MAPGEARPAAFLNAKGRLLHTCWVAVLGDTVWLSVPDPDSAALAAMLEQFHFTERLEIARIEGLGCFEHWSSAPLGDATVVEVGDGVRLSFPWHGVWRDRWHVALDRVVALAADPEPLSAAEAACLRIATAEPWVGVEVEPGGTLALELPIADHISTTKGCYTGQEIVARLHTYGHTNRALCRLAIAGAPPLGETPLCERDEGEQVGRVVSAAAIPGGGDSIAFGFLPNAFCDPGTELSLATAEGPRAVVLAP